MRRGVIRSPEDFDQMTPGSILVCPTTTPAWTPLFSQAAGLVTDIGGALAHGSIVAREYGIPAVMGTGVATAHPQRATPAHRRRPRTVTLVDEVSAEPKEDSGPQKKPFPWRRWLAVGSVIGLAVWWIKRRRSLTPIGVKIRTSESAGDFVETESPGVMTPSRCDEKSPALARMALILTPMGEQGAFCVAPYML
ncbi:MAG: PEP-utilizing enzyme [Caldilineaceae bacterium]